MIASEEAREGITLLLAQATPREKEIVTVRPRLAPSNGQPGESRPTPGTVGVEVGGSQLRNDVHERATGTDGG